MAAKAYVSSMTVAELTSELKKRGLNCRGKKKALQNRLEQALYEEENSESSSEGSNEATIRAASAVINQLEGNSDTPLTSPPPDNKTPLIVSIEHSKRTSTITNNSNNDETFNNGATLDTGQHNDDKEAESINTTDTPTVSQVDEPISSTTTPTTTNVIITPTLNVEATPTLINEPQTMLQNETQSVARQSVITMATSNLTTPEKIAAIPHVMTSPIEAQQGGGVETGSESEVNSIAVEPPSPSRDDITFSVDVSLTGEDLESSELPTSTTQDGEEKAMEKEEMAPVMEKEDIAPVMEKDDIPPGMEKEDMAPVMEKEDVIPVIEREGKEEDVMEKSQEIQVTEKEETIENRELEKEEILPVVTEDMETSEVVSPKEKEESQTVLVPMEEKERKDEISPLLEEEREEKEEGRKENEEGREENQEEGREEDTSTAKEEEMITTPLVEEPPLNKEGEGERGGEGGEREGGGVSLVNALATNEVVDLVVSTTVEDEEFSVFSAEAAEAQTDTPTNNNGSDMSLSLKERKGVGLRGVIDDRDRKRQSSTNGQDRKDNEVNSKRRRISTSPKRLQERRRRWGSSTSSRTPTSSQPAISSETLENIIPEEVKEEVNNITNIDSTTVEEGELSELSLLPDDSMETTPTVPAPPEEEEGDDKQEEEDIVDVGKESSMLMDEYEKEWQEKEKEKEQQRREIGRARREIETRRSLDERQYEEHQTKKGRPIQPRVPSPPANLPSRILHVENLKRPFTILQLKELLQEDGPMIEGGFWTNKIKSHCIAIFTSTDTAVSARNRIHGMKWPSTNPQLLRVDFLNNKQVSEVSEGCLIIDSRSPSPMEDVGVVKGGAITEEQSVNKLPRTEKKVEKPPVIIEKKEVVQPPPPKEEEKATRTLDDLFNKTKATPPLYWMPLSKEEMERRALERKTRDEEREKRREERRKEQEEIERERLRERRDRRPPPSFSSNRRRSPPPRRSSRSPRRSSRSPRRSSRSPRRSSRSPRRSRSPRSRSPRRRR